MWIEFEMKYKIVAKSKKTYDMLKKEKYFVEKLFL